MKNFLFVMRRMPFSGIYVQETLDMLLTAAAFDQSVSVLFADDGVLQLKKHQHPQTLAFKDTAAIFTALEIYDVNALYVETESLQARNLDVNDLILPVQCLPRREIGNFIGKFDVLIPD